MKGLHQYIDKHGNHFTVKLALKAAGNKWDEDAIKKAFQKRVYYNVTGATLGDIVFLTNHYHSNIGESFTNCIGYSLRNIGDYGNYGGKVFTDWLLKIVCLGKDFDFTPYI
jgi:hypothetical protein